MSWRVTNQKSWNNWNIIKGKWTGPGEVIEESIPICSNPYINAHYGATLTEDPLKTQQWRNGMNFVKEKTYPI